MKLSKLELLKNQKQECELFERYIKKKASSGFQLNILEAGCGRFWPINMSEVQYLLTGVDVNKDAIEIRQTRQNDLDETIIGDLRYINLEENKYDIIYNSFVLEHIDGAEHVLRNFLKWLKPGGFLLLNFPDRNSVFGFITRVTPFWFHVFYKKYILGYRNAGKPGWDPFPTFYDKVLSRKRFHEFCKNHGLIIREEYGMNFTKASFFTSLERWFVTIIHLISLGKLASDYNNLTYILEKK
jgi:2-polyprenyl-3-methyl-5-hydroxy-6-metoxy-1,4-benzoquinol methylase